MVSFSLLRAVRHDFGAARKNFSPSYFVTALVQDPLQGKIGKTLELFLGLA